MEELPIRVNVKIADRPYRLSVDPESETVVREAAKIIQDELIRYRDLGHTDTQEALAMIAFDSLVQRIRGERKMQRFQQTVFDKITQLDHVVTPAIST